MTALEFETSIANRSGISVERLRQLGRIVKPCFCPPNDHAPLCRGWQSTTPAWYADATQVARPRVIAAPPDDLKGYTWSG